MKLQVIYDDFLIKSSAEFVQIILKDVFGFDSGLSFDKNSRLLEFDDDLGAYHASFSKDIVNSVLVTGNNLLQVGAKHYEDYLYGICKVSTKTVIVSIAQLRSNTNQEVKEVSKNIYKQRLKRLVIHEIGHWAVTNQLHYGNLTNRIFDPGPHCPDNHCIMSAESFDNPKIYPNFFCPLCLPRLAQSFS